VIGPGWLPSRPRPLVRRRTLPYMPWRIYPRRKRARSARSPVAVNNEDMLFDLPPSELPVARVHERKKFPSLAIALRAWLAARWTWLRPRTVPVIVAFIGMCAVMTSAHYLTKLATENPPAERLQLPMVTHVADTTPAPASCPQQQPPPPPNHYLLIDP